MTTSWRAVLAATTGLLLVQAVPGNQMQRVGAAAAPQALAYVSNGQVQVFEAGTLTTSGPGQNPTWSPNGANLLFMRADYLTGNSALYVADSHGANARAVGTGAYPYIQPTWSTDSKSIVFAALQAGTKLGAKSLPLEIRSLDPVSKVQHVLAKVTITGGCTQDGTALQVAAAMAQGSYRGIPSTLIWARPNVLVVQASCSGSGLLLVPLKGKATALPGWSSAVLSPNGSTVAAVVTNAKANATQIGLIALPSLNTTMLAPKLGEGVLTWTRDSTAVLAISEPSNSANGASEVFRLSKDGKHVLSLGFIQGSGVYHPSVDRTGNSLAVAVIASAASRVGALPQTTIDLLSTVQATQIRAFFVGTEPSWRP